MGRKKKDDDNIELTHEEYREMKLFYGINKKTYKKDKKIDNSETKNEMDHNKK